ncbi:MAG: M48 family peptidase, partial [Burkholderiaceae bacterium]|nr:M48 family peptidase [Burkholderiaceae bacterium]
MQMIRWAAGALLAVSLLAAGCQSVQTTGTGAIGVDRTQRMSTMISEADLERQAALAYREELGKVRQKGALNTDAAMTSRVRAISNRLIRVSTAFRPDA